MMVKLWPSTIVLDPHPTLDNEVPCSGLKMTLWDKKSMIDRKVCVGWLALSRLPRSKGQKVGSSR